MKGSSITGLCALSGISRQAYYVGRKSRRRRAVDTDRVIERVRGERGQHPRMGTRKLLQQIQEPLRAAGVQIGRDRLFAELRTRDMLVKPKRRWVKTTNSKHNLPLFRNLVASRAATAPHQIWVADITHLRTDAGWLYLFLIMDLYSRKIVGWHLARTLEKTEAIKALVMAIKQLPAHCWPIHHSDRGGQYCSRAYTKKLLKRGLSISMTEENHCAENAHAERVNGILKNEYNLDLPFRFPEHASLATAQAITMYNNYRPHNSLAGRKPAQVHGRPPRYSTRAVIRTSISDEL